jgi:hypothetical protein|tara:strand:+ start:850 stop:999 length:150 start_codon:yes stop_codon:yes gene_type:complete
MLIPIAFKEHLIVPSKIFNELKENDTIGATWRGLERGLWHIAALAYVGM